MPAPTKFLFGFFVFALLLVGCQRDLSAQRSGRNNLTATATVSIEVTLDDHLTKAPVSGRLLVFFSKKNPTPITGPNWLAPEPFTGIDVFDWKPGTTLTIPVDSAAYPSALTRIPAGAYFVQAVLKRNLNFANAKDGVGNLYSRSQKINLDSRYLNTVKCSLAKAIATPARLKIPTAKIVSRRSELLSAFHGRDIVDRALVLLPPSYRTNPQKTYPVYYEITGFVPTIEDVLKDHRSSEVAADGVEFIHVYLTGQCQWGHHVYANSQTNGPRGDALVKEMIPAIDAQFRTVAKPYARLLGGHSSGGWSSLWLQTHYPKFFGGVWSTAPDPVDFHDWQGTDLYDKSPNVFRTPDGRRRPLAIDGDRPILWYEDFSKMDDVLERGGQLRSFEAVFSPRGDDGLPMKCWNRDTGKVNPAVVSHWKQYDISDYLGSNWDSLKGDLDNKIHVFIGEDDTYLLTGAVRLLKQRLQGLGSDAEIQILRNGNHFNLFESGLREYIFRAMAEKFTRAAKADASTSR